MSFTSFHKRSHTRTQNCYLFPVIYWHQSHYENSFCDSLFWYEHTRQKVIDEEISSIRIIVMQTQRQKFASVRFGCSCISPNLEIRYSKPEISLLLCLLWLEFSLFTGIWYHFQQDLWIQNMWRSMLLLDFIWLTSGL